MKSFLQMCLNVLWIYYCARVSRVWNIEFDRLRQMSFYKLQIVAMQTDLEWFKHCGILHSNCACLKQYVYKTTVKSLHEESKFWPCSQVVHAEALRPRMLFSPFAATASSGWVQSGVPIGTAAVVSCRDFGSSQVAEVPLTWTSRPRPTGFECWSVGFLRIHFMTWVLVWF